MGGNLVIEVYREWSNVNCISVIFFLLFVMVMIMIIFLTTIIVVMIKH